MEIEYEVGDRVADTFNFAHDILGVQNNMDRSGNGKLINCFLPPGSLEGAKALNGKTQYTSS